MPVVWSDNILSAINVIVKELGVLQSLYLIPRIGEGESLSIMSVWYFRVPVPATIYGEWVVVAAIPTVGLS